MKKKRLAIFLTFIMIISCLVGCDSTKQTNVQSKSEITFTDIAGREVTIKKPVKRIIVNNRSLFDSLFAVGGEEMADMIIATSGGTRGIEGFNKTYGEKFPKLKELEQISGGGGSGGYDAEKIISLKPDVVILINQKPDQNLESLDKVIKVGIPVVCLSYNIEPLEDRVKNIEIIGKILGKEERAKEICDFITDKYELVNKRLENMNTPAPNVHQLTFHGDTPKSFWSWAIIAKHAGGHDIAEDIPSGKLENGGTIDNEYLLKRDPDIITMGGDALGLGGNEKEAQAYLQEMVSKQAGWESLSAVKNKRVYAISYSTALNLETFYANMQLAKWYYPKEFEDIDPDATLKEFYDKYMVFDYEGIWSTQLK
ncbi:ABC transporter substrate-binding protein [Clostridium sp. MSJ-4]|uniref:ABC transporter substrate-binding protein n=1 Tax=Clostridium simiarum TaxID=2841506 RepID=A0ABS6EZ07_9CLOT|nr:ABC transporter substrate-binding protein [Clostridium simiarum]MBU5591451.1 ABC transporter substrate-binding protein [Clostridium simiarum]